MTGPFKLYEAEVPAAWCDANRHLNDGYYAVAFGEATWNVQDFLGMDPEYRARTAGTLYTVEAHITYEREVAEGAPIRVESQLLGVDRKRIRLFHRMFATDENYLASTMDLMMLHVDQQTVRTAPMPPEILARVSEFARAHSTLAWPKQAGRQIKDIGVAD